jgi:superfamily I DNA and/or RNA helicase
MKREGLNDENNIAILTIDQCQGQEADYVLLSLVQKPTRFLDKYRFNVALSRVRKRLFMVTSRTEFQRASNDSGWECSLIAKDLLGLHQTM